MRMAVLHGSSGTARLLFASRPANASDYLAAGKLRCGRCDKRYVGAAARGTSTGTGTTSASPASATARPPAPPTGCPPMSWTARCWRRC